MDITRFTREFEIAGDDFSNAGDVSTQVKALLKQAGYPAELVRRLAISVFEAEMNVVMYARRAQLTLSMEPESVRVVVEDHGPGIPDVDLAMQEGYSTATPKMREMGFGAGMGLPNIHRNADAFNIQSEVGRGTRLEIEVRPRPED